MQSRSLGASGLTVSAIGMGAMPLSIGPNRPSESDAIAVIHHAIACGVTLIDTADINAPIGTFGPRNALD